MSVFTPANRSAMKTVVDQLAQGGAGHWSVDSDGNPDASGDHISLWDISNVDDMQDMFHFDFAGGPNPLFNEDISGWNVSHVTNMMGMFTYCNAFDQDISGWTVSNVTNTTGMFQSCSSFNQDISGWTVSNVTNMQNMFNGCSSFNQNISGWTVSSVTNMGGLFLGCSSFNQDISGWNVSSVTDMTYMFQNAILFDQDIGGWSNVPAAYEAGRAAQEADWNTYRAAVIAEGEADPGPFVESGYYMFAGATAFIAAYGPASAAHSAAPWVTADGDVIDATWGSAAGGGGSGDPYIRPLLRF